MARKHRGIFFFAQTSGELLLLYISGHAIKDNDGRLYFAARDTRLDRLFATGIPASYIHDLCNATQARCIIIILDTCFSGAFFKGFNHKSDEGYINASDYFRDATGTVVITASDEIQYAFVGERIDGQASPSLFTKHVIEGLKTGRADVDGDGTVTCDDLTTYVAQAMREEGAPQRPRCWKLKSSGPLALASNAAARQRLTPIHTERKNQPAAADRNSSRTAYWKQNAIVAAGILLGIAISFFAGKALVKEMAPSASPYPVVKAPRIHAVQPEAAEGRVPLAEREVWVSGSSTSELEGQLVKAAQALLGRRGNLHAPPIRIQVEALATNSLHAEGPWTYDVALYITVADTDVPGCRNVIRLSGNKWLPDSQFSIGDREAFAATAYKSLENFMQTKGHACSADV